MTLNFQNLQRLHTLLPLHKNMISGDCTQSLDSLEDHVIRYRGKWGPLWDSYETDETENTTTMASAKFNPHFLNFTSEGYVDYTHIQIKEPPTYLPLWFEVVPDWRAMAAMFNRNWHYPLIISAIYITLVFGIQAFMRNRQPLGLKRELFLWNGALGLFSIVAFSRVLPEFWEKFNQPDGFYRSLCVIDDASMPMTFWGGMFILSKVVELGDTFFIVLRKRPLQFLQWFHHAMSLTLAWQTGPYMEPICKYYIIMNYGVHSLMYPYFSARAIDISIPRKIANVITMLQFVQMIFGVYINIYTSYLFYFHSSCHRHPYTIKMIWLAYGSFAILFGELFYKLVLKKTPKTQKKVD